MTVTDTDHWAIDANNSNVERCSCLIQANHSIVVPDPTELAEFDMRIARQIAATDPPFASLIAAAYYRADTTNAARLASLFPGIGLTLRESVTSRGLVPPGM